MKPIHLLLLTSLFSLHTVAADCTSAMSAFDKIFLKADSALASSDIYQMSEIADKLKVDAEWALKAADKCDCDDAYYTAEVIIENARDAYLSENVEEATAYINTLKKEAAVAKKHAQKCGLLITVN